ncbi:MAG TPA: SGNH/GDSL hydrolase family protein [Stellaceae bacterium]|nr:SGNH/GDSL hydrolase family protein [Stellaceae bacterium]
MTRLACWRSIALAAALLLPIAALAATPYWCNAPAGWSAIMAPLERTAARISTGGPLNIVAIGSSSTVGVGATGLEQTYPSQLQEALSAHFPGVDIHVINRGISGQDAPEEVARLSADVVALHPDLVIWQVGTNAVLRRDNLAADGESMRAGIALLKNAGIDVVLMDLQYAPRVLDRSAFGVMEDLIADTANETHVGLFRRFALMRYWERMHPSDAPPLIGADGLHMTDAGYACLASDLAAALEANWRSEEKLARRAHGAIDGLARLKQGPFNELDRWLGLP